MPAHLPPTLRRLLPAFILASAALAACSSTGDPWPGVSADAERAYVAFGQHVFAVGLDDGQQKWSFPAEPTRDQIFYAAPAVTESGLIVAGSYDHKVYALDAATGDLAWTFDGAQDRIVGGPVAAGDAVYVPSADGVVFALQAEDGESIWSFTADGQVWTSPLVVDDRVYVGSLTHVVYALDRATGEPVWTYDVGGAIVDTPSLVDGTLVVGALGRPLTALDPATGEPRWSAASDQWIWANAASSDGQAYFGDLGGRLAAASVSDGSILEEVRLESAITGRPAIGAENLFVITQTGTVHALRLGDLNASWAKTIPESRLYGPPVLQGDTLLVGAVSRELILAALATADGDLRWQFEPAKR